MSKTYWTDKYNGWRTSEHPHWRWRKNVERFLEKKANAEKKRIEKENGSADTQI